MHTKGKWPTSAWTHTSRSQWNKKNMTLGRITRSISKLRSCGLNTSGFIKKIAPFPLISQFCNNTLGNSSNSSNSPKVASELTSSQERRGRESPNIQTQRKVSGAQRLNVLLQGSCCLIINAYTRCMSTGRVPI